MYNITNIITKSKSFIILLLSTILVVAPIIGQASMRESQTKKYQLKLLYSQNNTYNSYSYKGNKRFAARKKKSNKSNKTRR
jgi:hypothetical protein